LRNRSALFFLVLLAASITAAPAATVYKWVDENGTLHLSNEKPRAGVKFERVEIASSPSRSSNRSGSTGSATKGPAATAAQVAERSEVLAGLKNRECVIALESLDRKTSGAEVTSADEIRRLQQTVEANCSADPARRREQEDLAAKLRVANGPTCVEARNRLGDLLVPGTKATREAIRTQQEFVDTYCVPPVR
jgi:hypothetical protein